MKVIGITGGIASGKSTIARLLQNMGAPVIDLDKISHSLMEIGAPAWSLIIEKFDGVLNPDFTINRKVLGTIVFHDNEQRKLLNSIMHPLIMEEFQRLLSLTGYQQSPKPIVVEVPLLFEENLQEYFNETWCVWVDAGTQIRRLMKRNDFTKEQAITRITCQMSLDEKAKLADKVIDNTLSQKLVIDKLRELYK